MLIRGEICHMKIKEQDMFMKHSKRPFQFLRIETLIFDSDLG